MCVPLCSTIPPADLVWFLQVAASDMEATADRTTAAHMINAFRVVSVISIRFMGHFPSVCGCSLSRFRCPIFFQGLNLYVLTGIVVMRIRTTILQRDIVCRMLRLPILPKKTDMKPMTFNESIDHLKKLFRERNQVVQERTLKGIEVVRRVVIHTVLEYKSLQTMRMFNIPTPSRSAIKLKYEP